MAWFDAVLGPLNLIDWLEGLGRGVAYGDLSPHRIALHHPDSDWWNENPGQFWNLTQLEEFLESYHVVTYWKGFDDREIWCHVKKDQARWAEYLLQRAGAPVIMAEVDGRNVGWASNPAHEGMMPARWDDREPKQHVAPTWSE